MKNLIFIFLVSLSPAEEDSDVPMRTSVFQRLGNGCFNVWPAPVQ
jgi:hypothetical protein